MNMLKGYIQADYSPENWKVLLDIKAAADTEIDNAASIADVMTALNNAEAAMAAVSTLLDDAKAAAHASLNAALAGYAQVDYSPENWAILLNAMTISDADNAASVEDVTMALSNAEAAMAAVHTLLTDAKIAAHAGLETALAVYAQADYSADGWIVLNGFKTAGDAAIDEAADLAGVEAAQSAAVAEMCGVQTIAQILAAAKSAAHDALAAALGTCSESDYTGDDWTALNGFKTVGDTAIDEAEDLAGVEAAQSAAIAGMGGVQTIAQTLAAAKSAAHDALAAALGTYVESDYTGDDWAALNGFKTAGDTAINEAEDLAGVEAAQSAAVAGMGGVQTIAKTLAAAKSAARDALAAALGTCSESDYTSDDWAALNGFKTAGDTSIDEAADLAGVEAAQSVAVAGIGGVQTIAQTLAAAKSAAHDALAAALGVYKSIEVAEAAEVTEAAEAAEAVEVAEAAEVTETAEVVEVAEATEATEVTEAAEVEDNNPADDEVTASQEAPASGECISDAAEEKTEDLESAPESITPDIG